MTHGTAEHHPTRRRNRRTATLAPGALLVGLLAAAPADAAPGVAEAGPGATPDQRAGEVVSVDLGAVDGARAVRDFWTPERMRSAEPLDLVAPDAGPTRAGTLSSGGSGRVTGPYEVAPAATEAAGRAARRKPRVPSTAGKLFFTDAAGSPFVCTAAAINTKRKNQVITAGHCVHQGDGGGWFDNFVFVPRYRNGKAPEGQWVGRKAWAFRGWTNRGNFGWDQAIVSFKERNNRKLVRTVGGNGVVWGRGVKQRGVRVWGWPAQAPYTGEVPKRCDGRTTRWRKSNDAKIRCGMTGGSSGGPWLLRKGRKANTGYIFAVTSRRTLRGTAYLLARPNPKAIKRMIRAAN